MEVVPHISTKTMTLIQIVEPYLSIKNLHNVDKTLIKKTTHFKINNFSREHFLNSEIRIMFWLDMLKLFYLKF